MPRTIDEVIRIEKGGWKNYFVQTPVIEALTLKPSSESGKRSVSMLLQNFEEGARQRLPIHYSLLKLFIGLAIAALTP